MAEFLRIALLYSNDLFMDRLRGCPHFLKKFIYPYQANMLRYSTCYKEIIKWKENCNGLHVVQQAELQ